MPRSRPFPPDAPIFAALAVRRDGSRFSSNATFEHDEGPTIKWLRDNMLRRELLDIVNGDERQLELAMRRAAGEPVRTTGAELGIDSATVSRRGAKAFRQLHAGILANLAIACLARHGRGATLNFASARSIRANVDAYAVAIAGHNQVFDSMPTWRHVAKWVHGHWGVLSSSGINIGGHLHIPHVGVWTDRTFNQWELDVTLVIEDFDLARQTAIEQRQRAIYHFASDREFFI